MTKDYQLIERVTWSPGYADEPTHNFKSSFATLEAALMRARYSAACWVDAPNVEKFTMKIVRKSTGETLATF